MHPCFPPNTVQTWVCPVSEHGWLWSILQVVFYVAHFVVTDKNPACVNFCALLDSEITTKSLALQNLLVIQKRSPTPAPFSLGYLGLPRL